MQFFYCLVLLFFALFAFFPALAHIGGKKPPISSSLRSARCVLHIDGEAFVDNTEYFNKIIEGETLFGFYFLPGLTLSMAEDFALDVGLIWEKYFGHIQPWHGIRPALSIYYKKQPTIFVVGIYSLQDYPVTLLEPLYLRRKPFIEGLHFKLEKGTSYLSLWLNWKTLLSKTDQTPETFTLHVDGKYCLSNRLACAMPFQLSMYHLGGQGIPVKDYSLWCGTAGLSLPIAQSLGGPIHGSSYLLFSNYVKEINRPFRKGWGCLHMINWEMSYLGLLFSYWYGNNFSSENMGHPLYQSIRIEDNKVLHYEGIRSLLFLSIYKNWTLRPGVAVEATFRPYYDFKNRLLEYGFSCKLVYSHKISCKT